MHYTTYESGDCWHGTKDEQNGADYWIKYFSELPEYYITKEELVTLDWKWGKAPAKFAPGKMLMMWIYQNLLWSNDGLLFVTYDHYETFLEIV